MKTKRTIILLFIILTFTVTILIIIDLDPSDGLETYNVNLETNNVKRRDTEKNKAFASRIARQRAKKKAVPPPVPFNASHLNSSYPLLRDLYPGGFSSLELSSCDENVTLLVIIHSAMPHHERRKAIRTSWGAPEETAGGVRLVFLVAKGPNGELAQDLDTNDVITANFEDSYHNLTLKSVAMLDWISQNCKNVRFILKCDDDVFINLPSLILQLQNVKNLSNVIIGNIAFNWKPIRNEKSKYFMSLKEFAPSVLPNFTTGPAYIICGQLVDKLFEAALAEHWLSLEDVFLTGLVGGTRVGVELIHWPSMFNRRATLTVCNANGLIAIHNVRVKEQARLLRLSKLSKLSCSIREQIKKIKPASSGDKESEMNYLVAT